RERMAVVSAEYWDLVAEVAAQQAKADEPRDFQAKLTGVDGKRIAQGRDFNDAGALRKPDDVVVVDKSTAEALEEGLKGQPLRVSAVEEKPYTRKPYPPFMTSTLQQEAGRKLHYTSERTMRIAQRLYENGHITYMRTDSTTLSRAGQE
ncbi:DNA topoisomerase I, partial [Macrococcoides caseolyticum]|uniref:DNA topoisomerase n=1 Tax=Macrococcoides caseolyticum TaxID=69966 RepID=UPI000CCACA6F